MTYCQQFFFSIKLFTIIFTLKMPFFKGKMLRSFQFFLQIRSVGQKTFCVGTVCIIRVQRKCKKYYCMHLGGIFFFFNFENIFAKSSPKLLYGANQGPKDYQFVKTNKFKNLMLWSLSAYYTKVLRKVNTFRIWVICGK